MQNDLLKTKLKEHCQKAPWYQMLDEDIKKRIEHAKALQLDVIPLIKQLTTIKRLHITNHAQNKTLIEVSGFNGRYQIAVTEINNSHISL